MRSRKWEAREGLFRGPRLRGICRNALGLYGYLHTLREHTSDCVVVTVKYVVGDFGVTRDTLRAWLDENVAENLLWYHRLQHAICVHFLKPGYYRGNVWIPVQETHLDRRPDDEKTTHLNGSDDERIAHLNRSDDENNRLSDDERIAHLNPPLYLSLKNLPQESSSGGAAAPRTPDGARVGAPPELEVLLAEAVAAGDERQVRFLQERIAFRRHLGRRKSGETGDDGPTSNGVPS